jgi:hypothetical protein
MLKKRGGWAIRGTIGSCPQVPVILKSVSDPMLCATFTYSIMSMVTSKSNFYFQAKLVNNYIQCHSRRHLIIIIIISISI